MTSKRTPITRGLKARITPAAIASYHRLRAQDGKCSCPPPPPWIPGSNIYDSSNPAHVERDRVARLAREAHEAERARCPACPVIAAEEAFLIEELRLPVRPWRLELADFPEALVALEAVADRARPVGRPRRRHVASRDGSLEGS